VDIKMPLMTNKLIKIQHVRLQWLIRRTVMGLKRIIGGFEELTLADSLEKKCRPTHILSILVEKMSVIALWRKKVIVKSLTSGGS
jgi:hypothetical protein